MNLVDIFKELGATTASLAGNAPLLLTESSHVWVVEEGAVDLFVVKMEDGKPAGNLNPLMRYSRGDIFFGLQRDADSSGIGIIVRGIPGTIIHALVPHRLFSQIEDQDARESVAKAVKPFLSNSAL